MRQQALVCLIGLLTTGSLVFGCSSEQEAPREQSNDAQTSELCGSDAECSDGIFCNGREACSPESPDADERGCASADSTPCLEDDFCNEPRGACEAACEDPDRDRDGHDSEACGGDDCNDNDPNRFPGNEEVCDEEGHDEDCDPNTLGVDEDDDGFVSSSCCQLSDDEVLRCGRDCDDEKSGVNPGTPESCNEIDDNCNGLVDDGVQLLFFRDSDGDNFGVEDETTRACQPPLGFAFFPGDCNDEEPTISPVGVELCDGIDSNCSSGGGLDPTEDADGDGFAPPDVSHCIPLETESDCADHDARAFPGQTEFFTGAICETGFKSCACSTTLFCHPTTETDSHTTFTCIPEDETCGDLEVECSDYATTSPPSFDFDCDGRRTLFREAGNCFAQSIASCDDASGFIYEPKCNPIVCGDLGQFEECGSPVSSCTPIIDIEERATPCR